ncbi:LOW QUALITY PROTEIN: AraC family transcriptional regulator, partial [Streptomyces himastatinicus ATCC 53653]
FSGAGRERWGVAALCSAAYQGAVAARRSPPPDRRDPGRGAVRHLPRTRPVRRGLDGAHTGCCERAAGRAESVLPDLLHPLPALPIDVPQPVDERVRAVADALLADPSDRRSLASHARAVGVSRRTLTRLFVDDTGMSFDRWRVHVRLRAALSLLAEGQPVSRVAHAVGYATPSAFLAAFRRTVGTTPALPQRRCS